MISFVFQFEILSILSNLLFHSVVILLTVQSERIIGLKVIAEQFSFRRGI